MTAEINTRDWNVKFRPYQYEFMRSKARYPSMVCGWGTGKSMCLILKALQAAKDHPNNLVLVVRYSFTDLRDSTMRDFTRYTGINIPSNKDVVFPNGSTIMFRHGSELATLQNINLGCFLIEQGEEFSSAAEFHMLRGRLRREGVPHFGAVIANAQGHNWIWNLWERPNVKRSKEYQQWHATTFDNKRNLPNDFLDDLMRMKEDSPAKYQQFVMNSRDELDVEGSYYATLIGAARVSEPPHITDVPYEPSAPVFTFWDLGIGHSTAIVFAQFVERRINIIDYYENSDEAITHYAKVLQNKPYVYRQAPDHAHYGPHDLNKRNPETLRTLYTAVRELGLNFAPPLPAYGIDLGIENVRNIMPRCWFDEVKCARLLEALEHYRRRKNEALCTEDRMKFSDTPLDDWSCDAADAMRYLANAYKYHIIVDNVRIGVDNPALAMMSEYEEAEEENVLKYGLVG